MDEPFGSQMEKKMKKGLLVGVGAVFLVMVILFGWVSSQYNSLIMTDQEVQKAWAQVQNNYQRRADLIPNLVNTVKGEAKFEQDTLTAVINARSKVGSFQVTPEVLNNPDTLHKFDQAQGELSRALSRLMVVVEKYPELKANQGFRDLSSQLEGTENRITVARKDFNEAVQAYNYQVKRFPTNIVAGFSGYHPRAFFEATTPGADKAPEVKF